MEMKKIKKEVRSGIKTEVLSDSSEQEELDGVNPVKETASQIFHGYQDEVNKTIHDQREMDLLIDFYKGITKEQAANFQLIKNKLQTEIEILKQKLKETEERKLLEDEQKFRKIQELENQLQNERRKYLEFSRDKRQHYNNPFEESHQNGLLLNEINNTKKALKMMEMRNYQLSQQLQIKDEANLKLRLEKKQSGQMQKLLCDEKHILKNQIANRDAQITIMQLALTTLRDEINHFHSGSIALKEEVISNLIHTSINSIIDKFNAGPSSKSHQSQLQSQYRPPPWKENATVQPSQKLLPSASAQARRRRRRRALLQQIKSNIKDVEQN